MNGMYPIIRRKRRPLVMDVPLIPTLPAPVQPVAAISLVESAPAVAAPETLKSSDGENHAQPETE
jgi:hypothetical protein